MSVTRVTAVIHHCLEPANLILEGNMMAKMQRAQYLAHLILRWHQEFGVERVHQLPAEIAQRYLTKVAYFQAHQLSERENIREIAEEQIRGVFEHFYSEKLPSTLLDQSDQSIAHMSLGNIALLIRRLLTEDSEVSNEITQETPYIFTLPEGWQEPSLPLHPSLAKLPQKPGETVRQTLRAYFAPLATNVENVNVGGRELMVAMNEDLLAWKNSPLEEQVVTAYNPASFDFQLATGEESLVTHVLQGDITIVEVVLGYSSGNQQQREQER